MTSVPAAVEDALAKLSNGASDIVLDLSGVNRIDPCGLSALQTLAGKAKPAKVVLSGVCIDVYKVLKLMKIEREFHFQ
ncbi:MAG TPA: STAS domain-containing protein [Bryobacteraceae bacterium]|nr:STAS domain-containing protein [Bryobacteraceae bacterium]